MPQTRETYAVHHEMTTRWRDNDVYGHMNNAVFYEYVDTAVNYWLKTSGALDVPEGDVVGLVVASSCEFAASLGFPDPVTAGLGVRKIGRTSVTYEVALFRGTADEAAAVASFTHVYVDRASHRPQPLSDDFRDKLARILLQT